MSGVKYRAIYKNTTIDPPGTIAHCKANGVEIVKPKMRFFDIIAQKGFPTRRARFCCEILKEYKIMDMAVQGIRRDEGIKRAQRYNPNDPVICRIYGSKKNHVNVILPILEWTKQDITDFIQARGIKCHPLYYDANGNFDATRRLGCMGCPMNVRTARETFKQYPKMVRAWIKAGQRYWDTHPDCGVRKKYDDVYALFLADFFYDSYEDFKMAISPDLFGNRIEPKEFLENYFKVKL